MLATLLLCALPLAFGLAAVSDLLTMKIPDAIAIALILLFFPAAVVAGLAGPQVGLALVAALAVNPALLVAAVVAPVVMLVLA